MTRDPRVDPRPGDVLRKGDEQRHVILAAGCVGRVDFGRSPNGDIRSGIVTIERWRKWATNAEVVSVAPDAAGEAGQ